MEEIQILVTLQVSPNDDAALSVGQAANAAQEAIINALARASADGFEHALANDVSIDVASVDIH